MNLFGKIAKSGIDRNARFPVEQFTKFLSQLADSQKNFEEVG
jgi:hypothetical protein